VPYIVHPVEVAMILDKYTDDEDVICAGLLHDVLEDVVGYSRANLAQEFGERVAQIVQEVSEDKDPNVPEDAKATWRERKEKYLAGLRQDSEEAILVCAAEKMGHVPISPTVDDPQWTGDFNDDTEQMVLARTVWGEARDQNREARIAVAWSIKNMLGTASVYGLRDTYHKVILEPSQYSVFWEQPPDDNNLETLKDPLGTTENPDDHRKWREIYTIAGHVIRGEIEDPVNGAKHYYDDSIVRPDWANQESLVRKIDRIFFYRL